MSYELPLSYTQMTDPLDSRQSDIVGFEVPVAGERIKVNITRRDPDDRSDGYRIYAFHCESCEAGETELGNIGNHPNAEAERFAGYWDVDEFPGVVREAIDAVLEQRGVTPPNAELETALRTVIANIRQRRTAEFERAAVAQREEFERELAEQLAETERLLRG